MVASPRPRSRRVSLASLAMKRLGAPNSGLGRTWARRVLGRSRFEDVSASSEKGERGKDDGAKVARRGDESARTPAGLMPALPGSSRPPQGALALPSGTGRVGWDSDATAGHEPGPNPVSPPALAAQILSLFAEPGVFRLSEVSIAQELGIVRQDVRAQLDALVQAGHLECDGSSRHPQAGELYSIHPARKAQLEQLYLATAYELGETALVSQRDGNEGSQGEDDEPRLPITAGILSLFLPGTGQLLNGDIGRASLFFSIWALAMLTPYNSIILFVKLYAGAEAFFNAKIRRLERQRALQSVQSAGELPQALRSSV